MKAIWRAVVGVLVLLVAGGIWMEHRTPAGMPLLAAAFNGDIASVKMLLKSGENIDERDPKYGSTPLIYAAQAGHTDVVKLLLDNGADINAKTKLGQTALIQASLAGDADIVKLLLDRGAKLDAEDRGKLLMATLNYSDVIKLLADTPAPTIPAPATPAPAQPAPQGKLFVIPAKAGISLCNFNQIPAFSGMTFGMDYISLFWSMFLLC